MKYTLDPYITIKSAQDVHSYGFGLACGQQDCICIHVMNTMIINHGVCGRMFGSFN